MVTEEPEPRFAGWKSGTLTTDPWQRLALTPLQELSLSVSILMAIFQVNVG